MKKLIIICFFGISIFSGYTWACTSDFGCGMGFKCVKEPLSSSGTCMRAVSEYGMRQYNMPDAGSVGPNLNIQGQCDYGRRCPIGFRCDRRLKVCVKQ